MIKNNINFHIFQCRTILTGVILLNPQLPVCAVEMLPPPPPKKNIINILPLSKIDLFAMGSIGFVGHKSDGEKLYEEILKKEDAESIFKIIIDDKNSTIASKLYALCGLKKISSSKYGKAKNKLSSINVDVSTMTADVMRKESSKELIKKIDHYWCKKD